MRFAVTLRVMPVIDRCFFRYVKLTVSPIIFLPRCKLWQKRNIVKYSSCKALRAIFDRSCNLIEKEKHFKEKALQKDADYLNKLDNTFLLSRFAKNIIASKEKSDILKREESGI